MSEDFIAHAFDKFSQESKTSRSRYEGTGLGLAITKQLVDRMDGSIELKSKVGVGTTVIVKIPFKIGTQDKNSNLSDKSVSFDDYSVEGMKAHKYWSVGALITMLGTFYTGYKKKESSHKYFALSSMLCMVMAIYTGHKMITGNRKKKANEEKDTEREE